MVKLGFDLFDDFRCVGGDDGDVVVVILMIYFGYG